MENRQNHTGEITVAYILDTAQAALDISCDCFVEFLTMNQQ